jgi:hypothetical protein
MCERGAGSAKGYPAIEKNESNGASYSSDTYTLSSSNAYTHKSEVVMRENRGI